MAEAVPLRILSHAVILFVIPPHVLDFAIVIFQIRAVWRDYFVGLFKITYFEVQVAEIFDDFFWNIALTFVEVAEDLLLNVLADGSSFFNLLICQLGVEDIVNGYELNLFSFLLLLYLLNAIT